MTPWKRNGRLLLAALTGMLIFSSLGALRWRENWGTVDPGRIYRCAQPTPERIRAYAANPGIKTIINLRGDWPDADWHRQETSVARELGLELLDIPMFTHRLAPMVEIRKLVAAFDSAPKPMLIHCRRWSDRTALACSLYLALFQNASLDDARRTYGLWYGHTGWARGSKLPHLFDIYADWLRSNNATHSPGKLREWIATTPAIAHFAARIECVGFTGSAIVGAPCRIRFKIANLSSYRWQTEKAIEDGVHFKVWTHRVADQAETMQSFRLPVRIVEPQQTVELDVDLPAFDQLGTVQIAADLHDADNLKFREMGIGGWNAKLEIVDSMR